MKFLIAFFVLVLSLPCSASVTEFNNNNAAWQAAVGEYSTITFTEFPEGTHITDHYSSLGITFTDGIDIIYHSNSFEQDGAGLNGAFQNITVEFAEQQYWIAVHFPGIVKFRLYNGGELTYTSSTFFDLPGSYGFAGLVSTEPFDEIDIFGPGDVFIDNLYFGPPIPAPGALALLGIALLFARSRTRIG